MTPQGRDRRVQLARSYDMKAARFATSGQLSLLA